MFCDGTMDDKKSLSLFFSLLLLLSTRKMWFWRMKKKRCRSLRWLSVLSVWVIYCMRMNEVLYINRALKQRVERISLFTRSEKKNQPSNKLSWTDFSLVFGSNCWVCLLTEMQFPTEEWQQISLAALVSLRRFSLVTFLNFHWLLIMRAQTSHIYRWANGNISNSNKNKNHGIARIAAFKRIFSIQKSNETTTITTFIKRITYIFAWWRLFVIARVLYIMRQQQRTANLVQAKGESV